MRLFSLVAVLFLSSRALAAAAPASQPAYQTFDSNGVKIAYFVQGEGAPVILIHGWLASARLNWTMPGTTAFLAKHYQVIALDCRGHGGSDAPETADAYGKNLSDDVLRLMDHLHIQKAHLVGYSMGGMITAYFAAHHPERVLSATLGGMGWERAGSPEQAMFERLGRGQDHPRAKILCAKSFGELALTPQEVQAIRVPITVIVGTEDTSIRHIFVEPLGKLRPDISVVDIPHASHLTCIFRSEFRDAILSWLQKNTP